jgi:hypothetical protein
MTNLVEQLDRISFKFKLLASTMQEQREAFAQLNDQHQRLLLHQQSLPQNGTDDAIVTSAEAVLAFAPMLHNLPTYIQLINEQIGRLEQA